FAQWEKVVMPGSQGGAVYSICFEDSLLFAGIQGGLYVSSDGGEHWKNANPELPPRESGTAPVSLVSSNNSLIAAYSEPGVYISRDNGNSWFKADIKEGLRLTPRIIAANENFIIGGNNSGNTYKSYDDGITWEKDSLKWINSLAIQDSIILAQPFFPASSQSIYRSTNHGMSWTKVHSSPPSGILFSSAIAFSGTLVFSSVNHSEGISYILLSSDGGLTWNDSSYLNCTSVNSIISSPKGSVNNFIFAGTDSGIYKSSDAGNNWIPVNSGLNSSNVFSLAFKPGVSGGVPVLYAGTGDGISKSTDYGESWRIVGAPSEWTFASANSELYAVSSKEPYQPKYNNYHTVIYHSSDNGVNWDEKFSGYLYNKSHISSIDIMDYDGKPELFASIDGYPINYTVPYSSIIMSRDSGKSWKKIFPDTANHLLNLKINKASIFVETIPTNSSDGIYLFKSANNGDTWEKIDTGYVSAFSFDNNKIFTGGNFIDLTFTPPRTVIKVLYNNIKVSTDDGLTWEKVKSSLDSGKIIKSPDIDTSSIISCLYAKGSNLLVGMKAYNFDQIPYAMPYSFGGYLYHLIQKGDNWVTADSSFIGRSVFAFESSGNDIYVAADTGVFRSTDYGSTWNDISYGMKNIYVPSLFKSDNYLYANTINGIWKRPLSEITSVNDGEGGKENPDKFNLSQNYPNPFNPATTIKYTLGSNTFVSLKIYDILGREVQTLINGNQTSGNHLIIFNASNLSSGVYFYQLKAENFVETKKLLLLK
ncbi:MAG: T9SS type A sorting domain-containing protein, partial [Ignavibacteriaceae bacterium]